MDFDELRYYMKRNKPKTSTEKIQRENDDLLNKGLENNYKLAQASVLALFLKYKDRKIEELINEITRFDYQLKEYMYDCLKDM